MASPPGPDVVQVSPAYVRRPGASPELSGGRTGLSGQGVLSCRMREMIGA
ncbi:hypothetical protein ACQZM9_02670 [Streptomyces sp. P11-1]